MSLGKYPLPSVDLKAALGIEVKSFLGNVLPDANYPTSGELVTNAPYTKYIIGM